MSDSGYIIVVCIVATMFGFFLRVAMTPSVNDFRAEAIKRGYALHCPKDGRFAWKGECDD